MSSLKLNRQQKKMLLNASRNRIEDYFDTRSAKDRAEKWLNKNNRYRRMCTKTYQKDAYLAIINDDEILSYVSASAITHIIDGWSYLGRAVDAVLKGDSYRTIHLAYYAELRAAMGLLGAEGIGVLDAFHALIDSSGKCHVFPRKPPAEIGARGGMSTHNFVWLALEHWAGLKKASNLLGHLVAPSSFSLPYWLDSLGVKKPLQPLAKKWLETWGVDLSVIGDDRNLRNLASYRPQEFRKPEYLKAHETVQFVEDLWKLFEPNNGKFPNLEKCLLRRVIRRLSAGRVSSASLTSLGMSQPEAESWEKFLNDPTDPLPLRFADVTSTVDDPNCHLQVISRAAMLLFVASSVARELLVKAGYKSNDLLFWWGLDGEGRGIWDKGSAPANLTDMWADIQDDILESEKWRGNIAHNGSSLKSWYLANPEIVHNFGRFELAGMWAIIP